MKRKTARINKPKPVEIPERSCTACEKTAPKPQLLRFVTDGAGNFIFDRKGRLPGRGVYFCFDNECLTAACKKNLFAKGFKDNINKKSPEELLNSIYGIYVDYFFALLKSGRGGGLVVGGSTKCEKLLEAGQVMLVLIPDDASEDTVKKTVSAAEAKQVKIAACPSKITMSEELDLPLRAAFAITDEPLALLVLSVLEKLQTIKSWLNGV